MDDDYHRKHLYRWKKQEDPRSYSRSQKVTSNNDIQDWIKKVEEASNRAAEEAFGINHSSGRRRGKSAVKAAKEFTVADQDAYTEAQDLLSQWMDEKVNLHSHLDPEIDATFDDDSWQRHEIQSDVKREWDNLLANNLDDYEPALDSYRTSSRAKSDIYNLDEEDAVARVMENMMGKQLVKKEFKKDLGLNKWDKQTDPKTKMELRQKQVRENREKREEELRRRREQQKHKKEAMHQAKTLVMKEEKLKELETKKEEMAIRKEMGKIRKEMQEERKKLEDRKAKEKQAKEETLLAARSKVAWDEDKEAAESMEEERRREERERLLQQRIRELEAREVANNLKILHRHFSAWYNVVLDRRLKMGKARAMSDWKLILRAWNAWRAFVRDKRVEEETKHQEMEAISTQRNQQKAMQHSRLKLLRKYFIAWQVWVKSEQERRELDQAQANTRNKMMSLLEAAATGKLGHHDDPGSTHSTARGGAKHREAPTTAEKIHSLFSNNSRKTRQVSDSLASSRSEDSMATVPKGQTLPSRVPTQPWQVTKKHIDLTPEELAEMGNNEPVCSPDEMDAKVLKKYGRQPWHKLEVSSYEHRHNTQKHILAEQKRQIQEQQCLIEELQFKSTHMELQKQLVEQKLVLQNIAQQVEVEPGAVDTDSTASRIKEDNNNNSSSSRHKPSKTTSGVRSGGHNKTTSCRPASAPIQRKGTSTTGIEISTQRSEKTVNGADSSRSSVAGPGSARTNVSRPASYTSTTSEQSKYLEVMKKMEERHAERAKLKAEREEKRRLAEEQRLAELEAIEAERKRQEEEEKRARVEAFRERKRLEQQREAERLLREEKLRVQNEMADQHYQKAILKYRGLVPLRKLVTMAKEQEKIAAQHYQDTLLRNTLRAWHAYVKDFWREREALADEMNNFLCVKHCFQNWRVYKHHMIILEHRAVKHFQLSTITKVFQAWRDYANEEKVASWEKERRAREHYRMLLLRRHFKAWYKLPEEIEKEKERERRREELRQKVASILPDFEVIKSLDKSVDLTAS